MKVVYWTFAALMVTSGAHASPILIDFESVPAGAQTSYTESGVTFTTITGSEFVGSPTPNGTQGLIANEFLNTGFSPLFRADILGGAAFVSVDLGDFGIDPNLLMLNAFDASDNLVDFVLLPIDASVATMTTLSVSGPNIAYVLFGTSGPAGNTVFADNFVFEPASAVPEPASVALLGLGGLGLVGWSRRRKTVASIAS